MWLNVDIRWLICIRHHWPPHRVFRNEAVGSGWGVGGVGWSSMWEEIDGEASQGAAVIPRWTRSSWTHGRVCCHCYSSLRWSPHYCGTPEILMCAQRSPDPKWRLGGRTGEVRFHLERCGVRSRTACAVMLAGEKEEKQRRLIASSGLRGRVISN